jgi:hypothetical protein
MTKANNTNDGQAPNLPELSNVTWNIPSEKPKSLLSLIPDT